MKMFNTKKLSSLIGIVTVLLLCGNHSQGMGEILNPQTELSDYFQEAPWLGLVADEMSYGPIEVSHVHMNHGDKVAIVAPGSVLSGTLKYRIRAKDLDSLHLYHLVVGITGVGPQECLTHSMGVLNSKGKAHFNLTAPEKPGVYQVRFLLAEGATCSAARDAWESADSPSFSATLGVIIVE